MINSLEQSSPSPDSFKYLICQAHIDIGINRTMFECGKILTAPPSQPSTPEITLTTTHILEMKFMVEQGSYPITDFLLNTTRVLSDGESSTSQTLVAVDDPLYVEAVVEVGEGEWEVVMVLAELQQLQLYTFQVAAVSAVGPGEFSESSIPTALGKANSLK